MRIGNFLSISTEGSENKESLETEVEIYSMIGEHTELEQADSKEQHVQLETEFKNGTRCRVRKVTKDSQTKYYLTMKVKEASEGAIVTNREHTIEIDSDYFEGFKHAAERELVKTRYSFHSRNVTMTLQEEGQNRLIQIPNVTYEVDVYTGKDGNVCDWCKIDVEVDNIINFLSKEHPDLKGFKLKIAVSHLPFKPYENILKSEADKSQADIIKGIWEKFTRPVILTEQ